MQNITLLKNADGSYYIELSQELCEQLGLTEETEFDIVIAGNELEIRRR